MPTREERIEELTDALNRNTAALVRLDEHTCGAWRMLERYIERLEEYEKVLVELIKQGGP